MKFLRYAVSSIVILFGSSCIIRAVETPAKPNILIILADDLGYGDVHSYNPERGKIATPNIDALAAQSMRFTDAHSSSGVCSPSRYTLLTGRYHWRSRLQVGIVGVFGAPLIAPDRLTLPSLVKQHGYRTAAIGKWHLGWDWPMTAEQRKLLQPHAKGAKQDEALAATPTPEQLAAWNDIFGKQIPGGPTTRGFDSYFGTDVPNWPPYCFIENDRTQGIPSEFLPARDFKNNRASLHGPALKDWSLEHILPTLGDRACAFITESAKKPEPFLLYLPLTSPHTPLAVNEPWKGKSNLNPYADFVMETDAVIGRVLDALEKSGAAANTLIVFTSDNGCAPYIGAAELEKMGHFPSGPLRGYKADVWEGGHRVSFVVRWPGVVKPASTCSQLVHHADVIATVAEILGAKLPETAGEDSISFLPLLKGSTQPIREHAISTASSGVPGLRVGNWKYIPGPGGGGFGKGGEKSPPVQLYDLSNDIGEKKNLTAEQPERVAQMKALLEKLITDGRSTPGAPQKNDVAVRRFPSVGGAAKKKGENAEN